MTSRSLVRSVVLLVVGVVIGAVIMQWRYSAAAQAPAPSAASQAPPADLKTLAADVERLKALLPSKSHIMMDVQWHWTNLWFAGQAKNWPLAQFYFNETRSHIQWLMKKSPKIRSQGPDKEEVDVQAIFDAVDTSSLADVKNAIAAKDSAKFAATYKTMLDSCYSCHKSVGRPYLRPMIPKMQVQSALEMDPNGT
jgi:cytochrome c553